MVNLSLQASALCVAIACVATGLACRSDDVGPGRGKALPIVHATEGRAPSAPSSSPLPSPSPGPATPAVDKTAAPERLDPEPRRHRGLDCTRIDEDAYRRGVQFPITVVMIDGRRVEEHTADAYMAMAAAAHKDGVELEIHSGFRSMAEQVYFYDCYTTCSCNACAKAAKPGRSNHQSGRALDLAIRPEVSAWLKRHARKFGFKRTVRSEPWHWEYRRRRKHRFPKACPKP